MSNPPSETPLRDVALLFTAEEIARRVGSLADEIALMMANPFTVLVILKGAFMFGADLIRALSCRGRHPRIEFIRLGSYGDALETSGTVSLRSGPPAGVEGHPVLIVDDVLDSGLTLLEAKRLIESWGASEARTCVLVRKEGKQKVPGRADFVGFTIGDRFVVGYGIDCAENYRDLPYLGAVDSAG
jgi:hypoxanthine phosphoribosyltransferase